MVTSLSLAILAKERTFSSTVIDLKKKDASPTAPLLLRTNRQPTRIPRVIPPPPTSQTIFTILRTLKKGCQQGRSDRRANDASEAVKTHSIGRPGGEHG